MLDIKLIREHPQKVEEQLKRRGGKIDLSGFHASEAKLREIRVETEKLQARRNEISNEIGRRKAAKQDISDLFEEMKTLGPQLKNLETQLREQERIVESSLALIPNIPMESVPDGKDERDNVVLRYWPTEKSAGQEPFKPKPHWEIGEALGILDFEAGVQLAGARFTVLKGMGARLSRALINFMLDLHTGEHGYTEIMPPMLVNDRTLFGTGQLPKFEEDLFACRDNPLFLIPTAEVPLTNLVADRILEERQLPMRMTAWTSCFRREAGAAGKDTRGLIRQHQFDKVELVWITRPEESPQALEQLTLHAEEVLRRLELPFRTISLCTGDMGFSAAKTYDLEVWLPGQGCYREISSCSDTQAFQARRMKARFRRSGEKKTELVHTLNGSGVAVGRALVAILENGQQPDGSVVLPKALRPFMGGIEVITPPNP
ncbi:MAG: serine--tRNA ligase [Magnetococcales bacterium]|nr:serine--tRNA ligase [Magnetococcales bacterium]MBF0149078.1 serine--tRNA ligase [Magnetococcales bacterium]MBF0172569.1 serine--tRNA ligase [Magnetococcales bacterium]MBF0347138.1 serine--tRNA ligase [Magnetococcales bacterium]MBF0630212.1 serine--tRNA ligase [Magnetococcales bacterium]